MPTGGEPTEFIATAFDETGGVFSPDGRYLAYSSDETSRFEVYVREIESSRRFTVSTDGGSEPIWSGDGTELFYRRGLESGTTQVLAVPVRTAVRTARTMRSSRGPSPQLRPAPRRPRPGPNLSPVANQVSASDRTVCCWRLIGRMRGFWHGRVVECQA